jgi:hypothetical protein
MNLSLMPGIFSLGTLDDCPTKREQGKEGRKKRTLRLFVLGFLPG